MATSTGHVTPARLGHANITWQGHSVPYKEAVLNLTEYVQEPSRSTTLSKDGFLYGFVVRLTLLLLLIDTIVTLMFEEFNWSSTQV